MWIRLALVIENISTVICIHRIYGKKVQWDILTIGLAVSLLIVLDTINTLQIGKIAVGITYVLTYLYCKLKFKDTFIRTGISVVFLTILMSVLQFICLLPSDILLPRNEMARVLLADIGVLLICQFILPKMKIDSLLKNLHYSSKRVFGVLAVVGLIVAVLLLQDKLLEVVRAEIFMFAIPMILIVLPLLGKWNSSKKDIEQMEKELESTKHLQSKFESILEEVRLRQHEFKNHITAIISSHYTHKTYEKLVQAQSEYFKMLSKDNKYNDLLFIKNNVLAGFLYEKFKEVEDDVSDFEYKIHSTFLNIHMPTYHMIEIMGILIDNAVEATKDDADKMVSIEAYEDDKVCYFTIGNTHKYIEYSTIEQWFQQGVSTKGINRGIGLYHVRTLCEEWGCNIRCECISKNDKNWVQFTLEINKAAN